MIADLLESGPVAVRPKTAWLLVAASALFAALLAYTLFAGYLPAKQRIERLEAELRAVYQREAQLQTERDALTRRVETLERELAAARRR